MEDGLVRTARGRSAELDGRRINAVSPMHLGESKMLQSLLMEAQQQQATSQDKNKGEELMEMLEKYQSSVKLHQQRTGASSKSSSKNNLNQITPIALPPYPTQAVSIQMNTSRPHPISQSQPCLIAVSDKPPDYSASREHQSLTSYIRRSSGSNEHPTGDSSNASSSNNNNPNQRVPNHQKMIQSLREENVHLKRENETLKKKLTKLPQIEVAYDRIEREYESLIRDRERQEGMEKSALVQMDMRMQRLIAERDGLQERLEQQKQSSRGNNQAFDKLNQQHLMIADLMTQKQELLACKERQKLEIDEQNATLEEQRNHIGMLQKALANAQDRLTKREKLCEELSNSSERAAHLQRILQETLQDKQVRVETHAQERTQWEMEVTQLRMQLNKEASLSGSLKRSNGPRLSIESGDEAMGRLKKSVLIKDERIIQLEKNVVELQKKLQEESERKKCALGALSETMEAKLRRQEDEKRDKDRKIAELIDEKERLTDMLESTREYESGNSQFMHKMDEIGRKIQERKRKGRAGTTGGLIGIPSDHSRSSSGSLLPSTHRRSSSGPFDPATSSVLLDPNGILPSTAGDLSTTIASYGNNTLNYGSSQVNYGSPQAGYGSGVSMNYGNPQMEVFRQEKREDESGASIWNV